MMIFLFIPWAIQWLVLTFILELTCDSFLFDYDLTDFIFPIIDDGNVEFLSLLFYLLMIVGWLYAAQPYSASRRKFGIFIGIPMTILFFLSSGLIVFARTLLEILGI